MAMACCGHVDANVPAALLPFVGRLLERLEKRLQGAGIHCWREAKEDGGHITPWWLYASLGATAPRQSQVVFGETIHKEVNPRPHLWVRGKQKWLPEAVALLRAFVAELDPAVFRPLLPARPQPAATPSVPRPPQPLKVLAEFDGEEYGSDYLNLRPGDGVVPRAAPEAAAGWAYGYHLQGGRLGWYPPQFVGTACN